ncbi:MAG: lipid-A-disaccharide synthase [Bacteroidales bacterium]|nr:lipid-A-disaccharide synthase [Bacteroidales bacterium]
MNYYIIAGEASGDLHGSNLILALKEHDPSASFRCWGGDLMQLAGGNLVKHYRDLAFMGFWEVLIHLKTILSNLYLCEQDILATKPDAVILIDYPGFNLRIAKFAKKNGIRVFYYISPQLWAWKSSRVRIIQKYVDRMFVILPFEADFYRKYNYPVDFVGHPLLDVISPCTQTCDRDLFFKRNNLSEKPIIALLPGSRKQEIRTMLKRMIEMIPSFKEYQFVVAGAPAIDHALYRSVIGEVPVAIVFQQTYDLLSHAEAALVTSGTATLETALVGTPEVVCYRGSRLSFWIARRIVHVPYISLVNLIMGREVVKELIQHFFTSKNLRRELTRLLDPSTREMMQRDYNQLSQKLGGHGASDRTASLMIQYLKDKSVNQ